MPAAAPPLAAATCACPWCGQYGLTPADLWRHQPLHHIYDANRAGLCCVCGEFHDNLAVHIHEAHAPGGPTYEQRTGLVAAVVVHRRRDNKFLMVQEFAGQGFWVPGGMADKGESIRAAALRECMEEAGVEVELRGVAEVTYSMDLLRGRPGWRMVLFYATPKGEPEAGDVLAPAPVPMSGPHKAATAAVAQQAGTGAHAQSQASGIRSGSPAAIRAVNVTATAGAHGPPVEPVAAAVTVTTSAPQQPKTLPDFESAGACWVSQEQLQRVPLRSSHIPNTWYPYFAAGGAPEPLELPPDVRHMFSDVEF